jgi:membrane protein YdbS with pleckstrin-like domain
MENFTQLSPKALQYELFNRLTLFGLLTLAYFGMIVYMLAAKKPEILALSLPFYGLFVVVFGISALVGFLKYRNTKYAISDNTISIRVGVLSVKTIIIPFSKITNVSSEQSIMQRLFGMGNILIDQEDSSSSWTDLDLETITKLTQAISEKSNLQRITK